MDVPEVEQSLEQLLEQLNNGDYGAAEKIFVVYESYLRLIVRRQISTALRAKFDSVDIVQSVWVDLLAGFREAGWRFPIRPSCGPSWSERPGIASLIGCGSTSAGWSGSNPWAI
jgi:hypothetical protein